MFDKYYMQQRGNLEEQIEQVKAMAKTEFFWLLDDTVDYRNFDFSFIPDRFQRQYKHSWGSHNNKFAGTTWLIQKHSDSTDVVYHDEILPSIFAPDVIFTNHHVPNTRTDWAWVVDKDIDYTDFNFDWLPDHWDRDKRHKFAMRGTNKLSYTELRRPSREKPPFTYTTFNYEVMYHKSDLIFAKNQMMTVKDHDLSRRKLTTRFMENNGGWCWVINHDIDYTDFDFNWLPDTSDKTDLAKTYSFAMSGTTDLCLTHLVNTQFTTTQPEIIFESNLKFKPDALAKRYWDTTKVIPYTEEFDWLSGMAKTLDNIDDAIYSEFGLKWIWILDDRIDYTNFDFNWLPNSYDLSFIHCFTMAGTEQLSYTWLINTQAWLGKEKKFKFHNSDLVFKGEIPKYNLDSAITSDCEWYHDRVAQIQNKKIPHEYAWIVDSRIDYSNFNFNWIPDRDGHEYIHCFTMAGTDQLSYTWLVTPQSLETKKFKFYDAGLSFKNPILKVFWPDLADVVLSGTDWNDSLANWVLAQNITDEYVWIIDKRIDYTMFDFTWLPDRDGHEYIHCFANKDKEQLSYTWLVNTKTLRKKQFKFYSSNLELNGSAIDYAFIDFGNDLPVVGTSFRTRFVGNMEDVLRNLCKKATTEWLYIKSSISRYPRNFDWNWIPDHDQIEQTHCWPTHDTEKGETFLIHIPSFNRTNTFKFNFDHTPLERYPWPNIMYKCDNLAEALNTIPRNPSLYTLYCKNTDEVFSFPSLSLWDERPVIGLNSGNSISLVPRECIVKEEIYEYPHLKKYSNYGKPVLLDAAFISHDEMDRASNYTAAYYYCDKANIAIRTTSNVDGRLNAYKAAAKSAQSDWVLTFFAKSRVMSDFTEFKWRPDYWQKPKHYIFFNHNADLDLTYGHMAPIAYNVKLLQMNSGGLDITLAQEHAVVPLVITQTSLTDPWEIWRTTYREVIKLLHYKETSSSIELDYRLNKWLEGSSNSIWFKRGAEDAVRFYNAFGGDMNWLMLTVEWEYLRNTFQQSYPKEI